MKTCAGWPPGGCWAGVVVLAVLACGEQGEAPAIPPAAASGAPAAENAAPAPDPGAQGLTGRFEPASADRSDVALGEVRTYPVKLVVEGVTELPPVQLVSSCDCLSARFLEPPGPQGGSVEVRIDGIRIEDIDGVISLEDAARRVLAEHEVRIVIQRRPFVTPAAVRAPPVGESFTIQAAYAYEPDAANPVLDVKDVIFDDGTFELLDWIDEDELRSEFLLKRTGFELRRIGGEEPLDAMVRILLAEPPAEFSVPVRSPE